MPYIKRFTRAKRANKNRIFTVEENRIVILLTTWPPCLGRRERAFGSYLKKKKSFSNEKHEAERRTASTH